MELSQEHVHYIAMILPSIIFSIVRRRCIHQKFVRQIYRKKHLVGYGFLFAFLLLETLLDRNSLPIYVKDLHDFVKNSGGTSGLVFVTF